MQASLVGGLIVIFAVGAFVVWVTALIEVIRTPDHQFQVGTQLIWVLVVLIATIVGAVIYFAIGRPEQRT